MTPAMFNILLALADGEKHGYAIMLEVEANTQGAVKMGPGTLYGSIKRMLASGLIEESDERPDPALDDERRRYYRLSGMGQRALHLEAERLERQVQRGAVQAGSGRDCLKETNMEKTTNAPRSLILSIRLYRALLTVYPSAFRQAYGGPMLQVFRDCCQTGAARNRRRRTAIPVGADDARHPANGDRGTCTTRCGYVKGEILSK